MTHAAITGVVDLHHHILPGVDDGATDLAASLELASAAFAEGIRIVIATPHTGDGVYNVQRADAEAAHAQLLAAVAAAGIGLEVRLAAEVHLDAAIPEQLRACPGLSLDGQGR